MMALGRLDRKGSLADEAGHILEDFLDVLRIGHVTCTSTTGRHEQEDTPHGRFQLEHELLECLILAQVAARERGVDLHAQIRRVGAMHRRDGAVKGAGNATERIVRRARGTVEDSAKCAPRPPI